MLSATTSTWCMKWHRVWRHAGNGGHNLCSLLYLSDCLAISIYPFPLNMVILVNNLLINKLNYVKYLF